jgi:hypothetical protein
MRVALAPSIGTIAVLAALASLPACAIRAAPPIVGGYATFYAQTVPANIYAYPHVWYEGGYAYLVGDRWFYPSSGGWVVLRGEPAPLYRFRAYYGPRGVPPSGRTIRQAAPPAYPGGFQPPPAERVR